MNNEQKKILIRSVEQSCPWDKIPTSVEGLFIVKTPEVNGHQTVLIELNPSVMGQPLKKRGVYIKNTNEYEAIKEIINNPKVKELIETINECYSKKIIRKIEI